MSPGLVIAGTSFWHALDNLVQTHELVIDRPKNSTHPRYPSLVYPFDYGYLQGATAADHEGLDVWCGSMPKKNVCSVMVTFDGDKQDLEIKLLVGCTRHEARRILSFHNQFAQTGMLVERDPELC